MMLEYGRCQRETSGCKRVMNGLRERLDALENEARELLGRLLDAERYREMVSRANARIRQLFAEIARLEAEIGESKKALVKCRVSVVNAKSYKPPGFNKDTHVNLDMQMWITHNQTRERAGYTPLIQYKESPPPRRYPNPQYKRAPVQQPQIYTSTITRPFTHSTTIQTTTTTTTTTTTATTTPLYTAMTTYQRMPPLQLTSSNDPTKLHDLSQPVKY